MRRGEEAIRYRLTPQGESFLIVGAIVVFCFAIVPEHAGVLFTLWLTVLLVQLLWPRFVLRQVKVGILSVNQRFRSGQKIVLPVEVGNLSRWMKLGRISLHPDLAGRVTQLDPWTLAEAPPPGGKTKVEIGFGVGTRGKRYLRISNVSTSAPFGLFMASRPTGMTEVSLMVWCAECPGYSERQAMLGQVVRRRKRASSRRRGALPDADSPQMRVYYPGDSARSINWRLSAKANTLIVVERKDEQMPRFWINIDANRAEWNDHPRFEKMLSMASVALSRYYDEGLLQGVVINRRVCSVNNRHAFTAGQDTLACLQHRPGEEGRAASRQAEKKIHVLEFVPAGAKTIRLVDQAGRVFAEA